MPLIAHKILIKQPLYFEPKQGVWDNNTNQFVETVTTPPKVEPVLPPRLIKKSISVFKEPPPVDPKYIKIKDGDLEKHYNSKSGYMMDLIVTEINK
jgi:hypothetical protein